MSVFEAGMMVCFGIRLAGCSLENIQMQMRTW